MSLNERISKLDSELSYAQKLAYERFDKINELEETLSHTHSELLYAQKLAYERFDKINELEKEIKKVKWILKLINFVIKK